ncbi:peptidase [Neorhizobium lilium]|uniref:Peptidase n=1 Tax=Neorhizobium lilium TaxID=2503024 RepID=A0A3S3U490_9HYPH|nr:DNA/RNA non-specific endonuclease [Neorhizobium lilium]RWX81556.1 peptidase [Neorhizobium lilium]
MAVVGSRLSQTAKLLRKDVIVEQDDALGKRIEKSLQDMRAVRPAGLAEQDQSRAPIRRALLSDDGSDPNAFERVIGLSDLVSINFLSRGLAAGRAVCRIRVPTAGGEWFGSGFLVGPRILATNNHVLSSRADAAQAEAEFGYEHDEEGVLAPPVQFNLAPSDVFFTDIKNDITLVGVVPFSVGGVPLTRFGFLPLLPLSGKGLEGEWVTLIQHPGGQPKQMAVRACQIVELPSDEDDDVQHFIHYTTDTEPGSSGAPVLNDQWQVVAIHHKAVPKPGGDNRKKLDQGLEPEWLANEGVRISAISSLLQRHRFMDVDAGEALARIEQGLGVEPLRPADVAPGTFDALSEKDAAPHKASKWTQWGTRFQLGYEPDFLPSLPINIDDILGEQKESAAPLKSGQGHQLDYLHFSTVVHRERKFPILTAVNVRGDSLKHPGEREGSFRVDARMDEAFQSAANFYEKKLGKDPVQFSRGHLVRRFDPCWGDSVEDARIADEHTFHYTNAAPQVQGFNAGQWLDVEDYVLDRAQSKERRMTVFAGPIYRGDDPEYGHKRPGGPWRIPVSFWKVVVVEKASGEFAATAFILGQIKLIQALYEAKVFTNLRQNSLADLQSNNLQTTIATVEQETGLNFRMLRDFDALNALESTRRAQILRSPRDIIL